MFPLYFRQQVRRGQGQHRNGADRPGCPSELTLRERTMHCPNDQSRSAQGSVLMIGLIITAIVGLVLAGYLALVQTQTVSVARSRAWNSAIPVAEGGVEEALAQLNPGIGSSAPNLAANGWEQKADGNYGPQQRRYLGTNFYDVVIVPDTKTIYSTGYTAASFSSVPISRAVEVKTTRARLFVTAMAAKENIDFKGFDTATDSYD